MHQELSELKNEVAGLKVDIADVRAEIRVTKHDVAGLATQQIAIGQRLDKLEERIVGKIEGLTDKLTGLNLRQERGVGFFAGVSAVVTFSGGFLLLAVKLLFGGP